MQAGNPIVARRALGDLPQSVLSDNRGFSTSPAEAALRFYTEFSNPVKTVYSWNRALPDSRQSFIAGDLALYIGFAGELAEIRRANPNLNFAVTELPQREDGDVKMTFGKMRAFAVPRTSGNPNAAFTVAAILTGAGPLALFAEASGLPPVRRDLLSRPQPDDVLSAFYNSAILSRAWLDPSDTETDGIFRDMIESTISGKARLSEAVRAAEEEINALLQKYAYRL
jgi:ABC-type glycerol-3-phosphate transport system substrate-binding protein